MRIKRRLSPPSNHAGGGTPPVDRARALSEGGCGVCGGRWTRRHSCEIANLVHAVGRGLPLRNPLYGQANRPHSAACLRHPATGSLPFEGQDGQPWARRSAVAAAAVAATVIAFVLAIIPMCLNG